MGNKHSQSREERDIEKLIATNAVNNMKMLSKFRTIELKLERLQDYVNDERYLKDQLQMQQGKTRINAFNQKEDESCFPDYFPFSSTHKKYCNKKSRV